MPDVLIVKPSSLGDIVHGLQVVTSMKTQRPELNFSWVVRDMFAPLVRSSDVVDHTYIFKRNDGFDGYSRLMKEIRLKTFDAVLDMQGLLRTGLMVARTRATRKIGRRDAREGAWLFYKEKVPLPPGGSGSHAIEKLLQFCPFLDCKPELLGKLRFREVEKLSLSFVEGRGGMILMFPDSRRAEKRWGGFQRLTELLLQDGSGRKVVWAGNNYLPCKHHFPIGQFLNLTGNTSLTSLAALVRKADWVISNDSGPMHLAAALSVNTLGIFGPTDPREFGPYPLNSPTNHVVQAPVGDLWLLSAKDVFERFQKLDGIARSARKG